MEYGRVEFVTEVQASEIKAMNKANQTAQMKHRLQVNRQIEDIQMSRGLGITLTELNQMGMYR